MSLGNASASFGGVGPLRRVTKLGVALVLLSKLLSVDSVHVEETSRKTSVSDEPT